MSKQKCFGKWRVQLLSTNYYMKSKPGWWWNNHNPRQLFFSYLFPTLGIIQMVHSNERSHRCVWFSFNVLFKHNSPTQENL